MYRVVRYRVSSCKVRGKLALDIIDVRCIFNWMKQGDCTIRSHIILEIDGVCAGKHTMRDLLSRAEAVLRRVFKRTRVTVLLAGIQAGEDKKAAAQKRAAGRTFERDLTAVVAARKKPLIVNRDLAAFCRRHDITPPGRAIHSFLASPVLYQDEAKGVIIMQRTNGARPFSAADASLISVMAPRLGGAIACDQLHDDNARLQEEVRDLSLTDHLTGIPNCRFFDILLDIEYRKARGYSRPLSLAMVAVDQYPVGAGKQSKASCDDLLVHIAATLKRNFRDTDLVARCDRNKFAVILPEAKNDAAINAAERVRKAVERAPVAAKGRFRRKATVSVGVVTYPGSAENLDTLLELANKALARAQQIGRNQVVSL